VRWLVTVYASDYETSKEFYRDTLGMFVEQTGPDSLVARRDGLEIRVDGGAKKRKRKRGWMQESGIYLTLETDAFDDLYGELQRRGAQFLGEIAEDGDGKRYAGLADPDGLLIEIAEA
jgi:predicted enzyme related to lactoylglutathione lyase